MRARDGAAGELLFRQPDAVGPSIFTYDSQGPVSHLLHGCARTWPFQPEIGDPRQLTRSGDAFPCYQLIRGVLAAYATGGSFCVFCDARRPDLIEKWYSVMRAVRICVLRCRLQLLTWQELTAPLPRPLRQFLEMKYGITR